MKPGHTIGLVAALVLVGLTACLPQFLGETPLSVTVENDHVLTITLTEETRQPVFDVFLDLGRVDAVMSSSIPLDCTPISTLSLSCSAPAGAQYEPPITVTVRADKPADVAVAAWWSVPNGGDRIARVRVTP